MNEQDLLKVQIEKVVFGGDGLARVDGKAVFVPDVIPGETVVCRVQNDKKSFAKAELVSVEQPSEHRIQPECQYLSVCGGCQYAHMTYAEEIRVKQSQVFESFEHHLGCTDAVKDIVPSDSESRYRSGITLHAGKQLSKKPGRLGYIARDHHSSVIVDDCLLAKEAFKPVFQTPKMVKRGVQRVRFRLDGDGNPIEGKKFSFYEVDIAGRQILASADSFFQNNLFITEQIIHRLRKWAAESSADVFLDLFAGSGLFGLSCAEGISQSCFVEQATASVECLKLNLQRLNREDDVIFAGKVEEAITQIRPMFGNGKVIALLDPPRSGAQPVVIETLTGMTNVEKIAYLSCDMGYLTRDLKLFRESGQWEIESVEPFDMFPRTKHIELLVFLKRKGS
ncbi:MAG: class I SAM-dependent RNA methyltransferase [Candidatus Omnitrophica bacterium]|nr:class I SAM-dependent RNA methyltransferase [Candidatus Omnitrophota bacterium]